MNKDIFSGLEDLGFEDAAGLDLYNKKQEDPKKKVEKEKTEEDYLFNRDVECPVCGTKFKVKALKSSAYRIGKKHSDFYVSYNLVNPYFYDVWICNECGYSALKSDFEKIKYHQIDQVKEKISSRWVAKDYPETYDVDIAIERYKLALLNYWAIDSKSSMKAMTCLKIAWMYRVKEDTDNEKLFLTKAKEGFDDAYFNEDMPIYGMDRFTVMYLIGELNRRIGKNDEALSWFSKVITSAAAKQKIKEMCRDQKDLIKYDEAAAEKAQKEDDEENQLHNNEKKGLFSKLFKR